MAELTISRKAKYSRKWRADTAQQKRFDKPLREFVKIGYNAIYVKYIDLYEEMNANHPQTRNLTKTSTFQRWLRQQQTKTNEVAVQTEPLSNEPLSNEPLPNEPLSNEPLSNEPLSNEPLPNEPLSNEPLSNEPLSNEPLSNEPLSNEPLSNEPLSNEPLSNEPLSNEPLPNEPLSNEPLPNEPLSNEPLPNEPLPNEPLPNEPLPNLITQALESAIPEGIDFDFDIANQLLEELEQDEAIRNILDPTVDDILGAQVEVVEDQNEDEGIEINYAEEILMDIEPFDFRLEVELDNF